VTALIMCPGEKGRIGLRPRIHAVVKPRFGTFYLSYDPGNRTHWYGPWHLAVQVAVARGVERLYAAYVEAHITTVDDLEIWLPGPGIRTILRVHRWALRTLYPLATQSDTDLDLTRFRMVPHQVLTEGVAPRYV